MAMIAGPSIGGLLNVTFGNAAELILALFVLLSGETVVVKGQITGSIIGNSLLGLGLAILIGTVGRQHQRFNRDRAGLLSTLLILVVIGLLVPALFDYTERDIVSASNTQSLDEWISLAATALTAWEADLVSGSLGGFASQLGLTTFFLGVIVLAVIGNAAEYVSAVYFARKDRMNLVMAITVGSTIQVGLLLAPVLVLVSFFIGHPMNLVFANPMELIAIAGVAFAVNAISQDGEVTWFEGALLIGVYILLAIAFFFVTPV
jgi:Ca2+:H+ antiporter